VSHRVVHQLVTGAGAGDAITSMALTLRSHLRERGSSDLFARFIAPEMAAEVRPMSELGPGRSHDVLVYHASFGTPDVTRALLDRPERLVIVYHNITPWQLFLDVDPDLAARLHWGRHELQLLRDRCALVVAVSEFNRRDLEALGFVDVRVIPAGLQPDRLAHVPPDVAMARRLAELQPHGYVLAVSQLLPHKRIELLLHAMHLVQWCHELPIGLVVAGHQRMESYAAALHEVATRLQVGGVWFTGALTDAELASAYRGASLFATASAHEGLALPPLEAMSFGVPVVAIGAGALPETIGGAGLVLPENAGPMLVAEAIAEIATDPDRRDRMRIAGRERVEDVTAEDPADTFVQLLVRTVLS